MKLQGLRWWIIGLIGLATIINYIDRSAINIMWPYIYREFGIADVNSKNSWAFITSFFMIAYAPGQTVTGKMMDAIGTRLGMVVSIIGWSISIALHALARICVREELIEVCEVPTRIISPPLAPRLGRKPK